MLATAFHRPHLAQAYLDSLEGKGITNAFSGLFLAGPRRIGKTTFLQIDFIPEAERRGYLPVYVDLWSNKLADPALLMIEALKKMLATHLGKTGKPITLDFAQAGLPEHITLVDLLTELAQQVNQPILLIIDEAQHALTTPAGLNAMFSLKSARDQMNHIEGTARLKLVFTGSQRDKLAQLVIKKDQPFFGAEVTPFPMLDKSYTDYITEKVNQALTSSNQFTPESMWKAFQLVGHRPEILLQLAGRVALAHEAGSFSALLEKDASIWHGQIWEEFENDFAGLSGLQRVMLSLLIERGRLWSPFSEESIRHYEQKLNGGKISTSSVQVALQGLRDQGFIWQTSRGHYALEDESFAEWFKHAAIFSCAD